MVDIVVRYRFFVPNVSIRVYRGQRRYQDPIGIGPSEVHWDWANSHHHLAYIFCKQGSILDQDLAPFGCISTSRAKRELFGSRESRRMLVHRGCICAGCLLQFVRGWL
jgi:hypothetical protein